MGLSQSYETRQMPPGEKEQKNSGKPCAWIIIANRRAQNIQI